MRKITLDELREMAQAAKGLKWTPLSRPFFANI